MNGHASDRDLDLRALATAAIGIAVMIVLALGAAWWAWSAWHPPGAGNGPNGPLDFRIDGARLESAPVADRQAYFAEKQRLLNSWSWVDRQAGIARIPIEDAMQILARGGAGRPPQPGQHAPSAQAGGRPTAGQAVDAPPALQGPRQREHTP